jgi:hypothetical protein
MLRLCKLQGGYVNCRRKFMDQSLQSGVSKRNDLTDHSRPVEASRVAHLAAVNFT